MKVWETVYLAKLDANDVGKRVWKRYKRSVEEAEARERAEKVAGDGAKNQDDEGSEGDSNQGSGSVAEDYGGEEDEPEEVDSEMSLAENQDVEVENDEEGEPEEGEEDGRMKEAEEGDEDDAMEEDEDEDEEDRPVYISSDESESESSSDDDSNSDTAQEYDEQLPTQKIQWGPPQVEYCTNVTKHMFRHATWEGLYHYALSPGARPPTDTKASAQLNIFEDWYWPFHFAVQEFLIELARLRGMETAEGALDALRGALE